MLSPTDIGNVYKYLRNSSGSWFGGWRKIKDCFYIFKSFAYFSWWTGKHIVTYLKTCLSDNDCCTLGLYKFCDVKWQISRVFSKVENEWPGKLRKNIEYLFHYFADFSKMFTIMTPLSDRSKVEVDDLGNIGPGKKSQNGSVWKRAYF